jgi:hypothetical protein
MNAAGIVPEENLQEPDDESPVSPELNDTVEHIDTRRLSVFEDFLEHLELDEDDDQTSDDDSSMN